ncbi:helix-turn-helix domain-containing protein [Sinorhizobium meliloti]|uniref:helix-turn-helix domain-containing protein n=1 Tax=Rhizobium meliloti TaxID=382 RepID=UPI000FD70ED5|nr:helix-turn-helix domain-containing protein [Sinorhizobium meliloti]
MDAKQFRECRARLGLSAAQMAAILNVDPRTIRKWESDDGTRPPNPIAVRVVEWMLDGWRPPQWPGGKIGRSDEEVQ